MPNAQSILERKGGEVATVERKATVLDAAKAMNERRIAAKIARARIDPHRARARRDLDSASTAV